MDKPRSDDLEGRTFVASYVLALGCNLYTIKDLPQGENVLTS